MRRAIPLALSACAATTKPAPADADPDTGAVGGQCTAVAQLASDPERCFETLQDAVDAALSGDTLTLLPAAAGPARLVISRDLTVAGGGVALEGTGDGAVVTVLGGTVALHGLRITGGRGDTDPGFDDGASTVGGAINGLRAEALTIEDALIEGNTADWGGGIMGPVEGLLILRDSLVQHNTGTALGGGVWMRQGALARVDIVGNSAPYAGGLAARATPELATLVTVDAVTITDNAARVKGGGLHLAGGTRLEGTDLQITDNIAQQGAGVHLYQSSAGLFGGQICDNEAQVGGGGLMVEEGNPAVEGLLLCRNRVTGDGLPGEEGAGGGLWTVDTSAAFSGLVIQENTAGWGAGAMVAGTPGAETLPQSTWQDVILRDNAPATAQRGAAIAVEAADLVGVDVLIEGNQGAAAGGLLFGAGRVQLQAQWVDNAPADVATADGELLPAVAPGAELRCDADGCSDGS